MAFFPNIGSLLFLQYPSLMQFAKTKSQAMYDPDHHRTIAQLIDHVGNKQECLRLGFLVNDDNETLRLSPVGMGYLIDIVAADINALPDAYAAGYKQGHTQAEDGS